MNYRILNRKLLWFAVYQLTIVWWLMYYYTAIIYDIKIFKAVIIVITIVLASTYLSLLERHLVAIVQQRVGPTSTGLGLLQPLADAFKLLTKEPIRPYRSRLFLFKIAPMFTFSIAITTWAVIPISSTAIYCNLRYAILMVLVLLTFNNYGIVLGAWSSYNRYAVFSVYRSIALTSSYGISISLIFLFPSALAHSCNFHDIVKVQSETLWFIIPGWPIALLFWIILLTEIKKIPFDVTESETELGSGYLIEYSGMGFALFIISEYCYLLILAVVFVLCFLGGWLPLPFLSWVPEFIWLFSKILICLINYLLIRSTLPNYRFDYIMSLHWKIIFPLLLSLTVFEIIFLIT